MTCIQMTPGESAHEFRNIPASRPAAESDYLYYGRHDRGPYLDAPRPFGIRRLGRDSSN